MSKSEELQKEPGAVVDVSNVGGIIVGALKATYAHIEAVERNAPETFSGGRVTAEWAHSEAVKLVDAAIDLDGRWESYRVDGISYAHSKGPEE